MLALSLQDILKYNGPESSGFIDAFMAELTNRGLAIFGRSKLKARIISHPENRDVEKLISGLMNEGLLAQMDPEEIAHQKEVVASNIKMFEDDPAISSNFKGRAPVDEPVKAPVIAPEPVEVQTERDALVQVQEPEIEPVVDEYARYADNPELVAQMKAADQAEAMETKKQQGSTGKIAPDWTLMEWALGVGLKGNRQIGEGKMLRVLMMLVRRADKKYVAYPGVADISRHTQIEEWDVKNALKKLVADEVIIKHEAPPGKPVKYKMNYDPNASWLQD